MAHIAAWPRAHQLAVMMTLLVAAGSMLAPAAPTPSHNNDMAASASRAYWTSALGENVKLPETLAAKLSPLTSAQVHAYSLLLGDGKLLASNGAGASLCDSAGLVCASKAQLVNPDCGGGHQSYARVEVDQATFDKMAHDPDLIDFFRESALVRGASLRLPNLRVQKLEPLRRFLPRELARPFELNNADARVARESLLASLPIGTTASSSSSSGTPRSSASNPLMVHVTQCVSPRCSAPPMLGETKSCVSSLEELADFAGSTFGSERGRMVAAPPQDESGSLEAAQLVDAELIAKPGTPILTCHDNMYPFQMYYCHSIRDTKLYRLTYKLEGRRHAGVLEKVATCHMDTSQWPAMHPAFAVLHSRPGDGEACHYIVKDDLLFYIPNSTP